MYRIGDPEIAAVGEAIKSGRLFRYVNMEGKKDTSRIEAFEAECVPLFVHHLRDGFADLRPYSTGNRTGR